MIKRNIYRPLDINSLLEQDREIFDQIGEIITAILPEKQVNNTTNLDNSRQVDHIENEER